MADRKYCYPNSDVLINKLDIRDYLALKKSEIEYTYYRVLSLQQKPIHGSFDFKLNEGAKMVHRSTLLERMVFWNIQ